MAARPDGGQLKSFPDECDNGVASPVVSSYMSDMVNSRDLEEVIDSQIFTYVIIAILLR